MKETARFHAVIILFLVVFGVVGCAPRRFPPYAPEKPRAPWDAEKWRLDMLARLHRWDKVHIVYQAKSTDSLDRVWRARVLVTALLPDRVRVEILNSWGQIQGLFLLKGTSASLWLVSEKTLYTSTRSEALLEKLVGIGVPGTELAHVLLGTPPQYMLEGSVPRRLQDGTVVWGGPEEQRETFRRYGLCPDEERLCRMELKLSQTPLTILFQYQALGDDRDIPTSVVFQSPTGSLELSRTLVMQPATLPSETFDLPVLGDAVRVVEMR